MFYKPHPAFILEWTNGNTETDVHGNKEDKVTLPLSVHLQGWIFLNTETGVHGNKEGKVTLPPSVHTCRAAAFAQAYRVLAQLLI